MKTIAAETRIICAPASLQNSEGLVDSYVTSEILFGLLIMLKFYQRKHGFCTIISLLSNCSHTFGAVLVTTVVY